MISRRAKVTKYILKSSSGKKRYDATKIKQQRKKFERNMAALFPADIRVATEKTNIAGIDCTWIIPRTPLGRTIIYLHGGGFVFGSTKTHHQHIARLAKLCKAKILSIDYSLAPEHPYPVALDEIQGVWQELLSDGLDPAKSAFVGDSAGGNLALASTLRFRDSGISQPACLVLLSPGLDASLSGESIAARQHLDPLLSREKLELFVNSYLQDNRQDDPYISPIFADLSGLPPLLVHVGTDEVLFSDSDTIVKNAKHTD